MAIKNINTAFQKASSFKELHQIAENAELHLSFLGGYYITSKGYKSYISGLDAFTVKVTEEFLRKMQYEFNEEERGYGKKIRDKIDKIYVKSDDLIKNSWYITKLIRTIRLIYRLVFSKFHPYDSRWDRIHWTGKDCGEDDGTMPDRECFNLYTYNQYVEVFGKEPLYGRHCGECGGVDRWLSPEQQKIREAKKKLV